MNKSPFRKAAKSFAKHGIVAIPVENKRPCIKSFNTFKRLSPVTIQKFSEKFPNADIAILTKASGLAVVDIDNNNFETLQKVIGLFGITPLIVETKRGWHLYFANPTGIKGGRNDELETDLKAGGDSDYTVAPPSSNYRLVDYKSIHHGEIKYLKSNSILRKFKGLPEINPIRAIEVFHKKKTKKPQNKISDVKILPPKTTAIVQATSKYMEGERNIGLFNTGLDTARMIADEHGHTNESYKRFQERMRKFNEEICIPPLDETEAEVIAQRVWFKYEVKGNNFKRKKGAKEGTGLHITKDLIFLIKEKPRAYSLLLYLICIHDKKFRFFICAEGLAEIMNWAPNRVTMSKYYLIQEGYIKEVSPPIRGVANKGVPAKFAFTKQTLQMIKKL